MVEASQPRPDRESVWDYPRPPRVEPEPDRIRVMIGDEALADTQRALRVLETSHPPVYYIPPVAIRMEWLRPVEGVESWCEWKGAATYFDLRAPMGDRAQVAWTYLDPTERYRELAGYLAFYPSRVDGCFVADEKAIAQEGDFYGGWITSRIVGPFKGPAGTWGW